MMKTEIYKRMLIEYLTDGGGLDDIQNAHSLEECEESFSVALSWLIEEEPEETRKELHNNLYVFINDYVYSVPWVKGQEVSALYEKAKRTIDRENGGNRMKAENIYNLIPNTPASVQEKCNDALVWFIENSSDLNEIFSGCTTLEELNDTANELIKDFKE